MEIATVKVYKAKAMAYATKTNKKMPYSNRTILYLAALRSYLTDPAPSSGIRL